MKTRTKPRLDYTIFNKFGINSTKTNNFNIIMPGSNEFLKLNKSLQDLITKLGLNSSINADKIFILEDVIGLLNQAILEEKSNKSSKEEFKSALISYKSGNRAILIEYIINDNENFSNFKYALKTITDNKILLHNSQSYIIQHPIVTALLSEITI